MTTIHVAALDDAAEALATAALTLARRFSDGATLWCIAPGASHHARHVAVEFMHPVVVGTRSLPAAAIDAQAGFGSLPALVGAGDVLLLIGPIDDPMLVALARRSEAWGAATVWIATHGALAGTATADVVLAYHLLWELTHVALGHPGLMTDAAARADACATDACITCSDDAALAEVRAVVDATTVRAVSNGVPVEIDVSLVSPVAPGDLVLCHAGLALTIVEDVPAFEQIGPVG